MFNTLQSGRVCRLACAQFVSEITIEQFFGVCVCVSVSGLLFLFILRIHRMFTTKTKQYRNVLYGSVSKKLSNLSHLYATHAHSTSTTMICHCFYLYLSICSSHTTQDAWLNCLELREIRGREQNSSSRSIHTKKMADVTVHRHFVCRKPNK